MKLCKDNIDKLKSDSICDLIIFYRNFSNDKESLTMLMEELANRRKNGEIFDFESKLKEYSKYFEDIKSKIIFSEDQIE